ncbi:MAG: nucleotide exchange factor GrpE [Bacteroidales bacterium]
MNKQENKMKDKEKDIKQQKNQNQKEEQQKTDANKKQQEEKAEQKDTKQEKKEEEKQQVTEGEEKQPQEDKEKSKASKKKKEETKEEEEEKSDKEKLNELQEKYLRLTAEYDNYRKRTLKEKMDLSKNAGEEILQSLLPVMDDFDRALQSIDEAEDIEAVKEGIHLIYNKFKELLEQKGVKEIEAKDEKFNTDKHEAVSKIPAPSEDLKGKVVDVIQKGYYLNDKVLRFSKVVVGE